ncbi:MAG TPA: hypothetical protein VF556_08595 [Pyrinomonadaceae bacterium]|jgi:hypothetical protein
MNIRVKKQLAIREAEIVFAQEIDTAIDDLKKDIIPSIQAKMREDTGAEKKNVKSKISGSGFRKLLTIYGDKPQTVVDEYGRRAGAKMPPWRKGSPLYKWVGRHIPIDRENVKKTNRLAFASRLSDRKRFVAGRTRRNIRHSIEAKQESISFLIARKIAKQGIKANRPFARTEKEKLPFIARRLNRAIARGAERLNK